jgi:enterochelin esterase-like enzyme
MSKWSVSLSALSLAMAAPGFATPDRVPSPRLAALAEKMDGHDDEAELRAFWHEVEQSGTPLIEPAGKNGKSVVTFVWRATGSEAEVPVAIFGEFNAVPWSTGDLLSRLEKTDVWYRSYRFDRRLSLTYSLISANASRHGHRVQRVYRPDEPGEGSTAYDLFLDPFNRLTIENVYWGVDSNENYFVGPVAPRETWLDQEIPASARGRVEEFEVNSQLLGNSRQISMYIPADAMAGGEAPALLVLFDGPSYLHAGQAQRMLDNLIATRRIVPTVAVFVDTIDLDHRFPELCQPNAAFADFIVQEVVEQVRQRTQVTRDPARSVIAGASCGALSASYVAMRHSGVFGNVLGQSSALWLGPEPSTYHTDWLARSYARHPRLPLRFYLSASSFENRKDIVLPSRRFRNVLKKKGYAVCLREAPGYHTFLDWRIGLPAALEALLPARSPAGEAEC